MTSSAIRHDLARQQRARERGKRWARRWLSLRAAVAFLSPGIVFLWGWAAGSLVSFAPAPVKLIVAGLMIIVAGRLLWRSVRRGCRR